MAQGFLYKIDYLIELVLHDGIPRVNENMSNPQDIVIYKGLPNHIDFSLRNSDRKKIKTLDKTLTAYVTRSEDQKLTIVKDLIAIDERNGMMRLQFDSSEIQDWVDGWYSFAIGYRTEEDESGFLYTDRASNVMGHFELKSNAIPAPKSSIVVDWFDKIDKFKNFYVSDRFHGGNQENYLNSLHTYAVYTKGFEGTVTLQGSLDDDPSDLSHTWFDIDEMHIRSTENPIIEQPMPDISGKLEVITTEQDVPGVGGTTKYFDAIVRGPLPLTPKPGHELRLYQNGKHIVVDPAEVLITKMETDSNNVLLTTYRFPQRFGNDFKNSNPVTFQVGLPLVHEESNSDVNYKNFKINPTWLRVKYKYDSEISPQGEVIKVVIRN